MPADDSGAITIVSRTDPDEASKALFGTFLRQPIVIAIAAVAVLVIVAIVALSVVLSSVTRIFAFAVVPTVVAITALALLPWRFRVALRRNFEKVAAEGGATKTMTFSRAGIDTPSVHSSAHFDWEAVKSVRRVENGFIMQVGRTMLFVSKKSFDSAAEYDQTLQLFAEMLGTRNKSENYSATRLRQ
jgi:hypothetical protein